MSEASVKAQRPAARILLLDRDDRILLFRFDPTIGHPSGARLAAPSIPARIMRRRRRRELFEETGIEADSGAEVARRLIEFVTLEGVPVKADERYFLVRTDAAEIASHGHTELERRVMRSWRWFDRSEIAGWPEKIWPEDLIEMLESL